MRLCPFNKIFLFINKKRFLRFFQFILFIFSRKKALGEAEKKLLEITATAEKRKKLLDEMATEKFELNQELTQVKEKISAEAEGKLKSQKSEADQNILQLKKDLKEQIAQRKQGEMRILDANRRIDELMSEVKKVYWRVGASSLSILARSRSKKR